MKQKCKKRRSNGGLIKAIGPEAQIQIALVKYISLSYPKQIFAVHVPNDMSRSPAEGYVKKLMGMTNGFPDMIIFHKEGKVLLLELKTEQGRISLAQTETHKKLRLFNQNVRTVWGLDQALQIIDKFATKPW